MMETSSTERSRLPIRFALSAFGGWVSFISLEAAYVFVVPHGPGFAPEIGPFGSFFFFAVIHSGYYLVGFFAITVPATLAIRPGSRRFSLWRWSLLGGILFASVLLLWHLATFRFDAAETLFLMIFAFVAGFVSFMPLSTVRTPTI